MKSRSRTIPALVLLLILSACGSRAGEPTTGLEATPAAPAQRGATSTPAKSSAPAVSPSRASALRPTAGRSSVAPPVIKPLPATLDFSAKTLDGDTFAGDTLQGDPVLLWFWAPWCPTCRSQLPDVQQLAETYDGRVSVVGVGSLDDEAAIRRFADRATGMTQLVDPDGSVWKHFGVLEQSSFVLLDRDGQAVFRSGYGDRADLDRQLSAVA